MAVDVAGIVREALLMHGRQAVTLPMEAHLEWPTADAKTCSRAQTHQASIAAQINAAGTKIIQPPRIEEQDEAGCAQPATRFAGEARRARAASAPALIRATRLAPEALVIDA